MHGPFGEDGQVQQLLEQRGLVYTGTGVDASALAMDKLKTKQRWLEHDLPTPDYEVVSHDQPHHTIAAPAVVKPIGSGSSVDVTVAMSDEVLRDAISDVTARYDATLVEQFVDGLELTVGILDERALPPIQIRTKRAFYDYQAKYIDDDTEYLFDIPLADNVLREIQQLSIKAASIIGVS